MQQLFGANQGTTMLPVLTNGQAENGQGGLYSSAALDQGSREVVLKLVNPSAAPRTVSIDLQGARAKAARAYLLTGSPDAENTLEAPKRVAPQERAIDTTGPRISHELPAHSVTVVRVGLE